MRNGQQHNHNNHKRMRGRNRGGRGGGHNPLTRVYESNGPDVKIRGTAHHIAEKYQQLARDAQSSGDPVSAESYLQHAEHYLRLIAAAQQQMQQSNPQGQQQPYQRPDEMRGEGEEDEGDFSDDANGQPYPAQQQQQQPQQNFRPQPANQPQPNYQPREQREQREQRDQEGGLPAFITGGAPQQGNFQGGEGEQGENRGGRFNRNRGRGRFNNRQRNDFGGQQGGDANAAPDAQPEPVKPE